MAGRWRQRRECSDAAWVTLHPASLALQTRYAVRKRPRSLCRRVGVGKVVDSKRSRRSTRSCTDEVLFGDIWERPQLPNRDRSLITCAAHPRWLRPARVDPHQRGRAIRLPGRRSALTEGCPLYPGHPTPRYFLATTCASRRSSSHRMAGHAQEALSGHLRATSRACEQIVALVLYNSKFSHLDWDHVDIHISRPERSAWPQSARSPRL